jgi:hypothetical protein
LKAKVDSNKEDLKSFLEKVEYNQGKRSQDEGVSRRSEGHAGGQVREEECQVGGQSGKHLRPRRSAMKGYHA